MIIIISPRRTLDTNKVETLWLVLVKGFFIVSAHQNKSNACILVVNHSIFFDVDWSQRPHLNLLVTSIFGAN